MDRPEESTFRTKTGSCTVTHDRIVLSRAGLRGAAAQIMVRSSVNRMLVIYGVLAAYLAFSGLNSIVQGNTATGAVFCVLALYLFRGIFLSRGFSAASEIARSAIQRVEACRPIPLLTRGYFVVHFMDEGVPRKRLIILPGILSRGGAEFEKAQVVLKAAGLMNGGKD